MSRTGNATVVAELPCVLDGDNLNISYPTWGKSQNQSDPILLTVSLTKMAITNQGTVDGPPQNNKQTIGETIVPSRKVSMQRLLEGEVVSTYSDGSCRNCERLEREL